MQFVLEHQAGFWLGLGFLLLAIELVAFGLGSGVLMFGGVGAIITGALVWFGVVPDYFIASVACFALSTTLAAALLWLPLKRLQSGTELGNDRSSDIIGHTFILGGDINRRTQVQQKYSGINWQVKPSEDLGNVTITAGTKVIVTAVSVGSFFVKAADEQ